MSWGTVGKWRPRRHSQWKAAAEVGRGEATWRAPGALDAGRAEGAQQQERERAGWAQEEVGLPESTDHVLQH